MLLSLIFASLFGVFSCGGGPDVPAETEKQDDVTDAEKNGNVIYVCPDHNGESDGTRDRPYSGLAEARDRIREIKRETGLPEGGVTVILLDGVYRISEPVELSEEDSGEEGKIITYKAENIGGAVIDGGVALPGDMFSPADEEFKSRLKSAEARDALVMIDLAEAGCYDLEYMNTYGWGGEIIYNNIQELYSGWRRQRIAQWPNYGEPFATTNVVRSMDYDETRRINYVEIPEGKAAEWEGSEITLCGLFGDGWHTVTVQNDWNGVDTEGNLLTSLSMKNSLYGFNSNRPFYAYNIPAELDVPGEYFWDHLNNKLYYYPAEGDSLDDIVFSQVEKYLVHGTDLSYVTFDGIRFEHGRGSGITCDLSEDRTESTEGLTVKNCTFRALGGAALVLKNVRNSAVRDNDLYELGCAGIEVTNPDFSDRAPANNRIENNMVREYSQFYPTANPGITARGMGFLIAHNEVSDATHTGILFLCGDSIVEYNICHDLCRMSGDAGGIYDGGSWAKSGNVIRYNYIYNINFDYDETLTPNGIYLDDMLPGQIVYGNTLKNIEGCGIAASGGRNMTIRGNVFLDMHTVPISVGDNGISFEAEYTKYSGGYTGYWAELEKMDYSGQYIRDMYPELLLMNEIPYYSGDIDDPGSQSYEIVENNVLFGHDHYSDTVSLDQIYVAPYVRFTLDEVVYAHGMTFLYGSVKNNFVYDISPGFEKRGKVDDALTDDSQVYRDIFGFERIPYELIGIQGRETGFN